MEHAKPTLPGRLPSGSLVRLQFKGEQLIGKIESFDESSRRYRVKVHRCARPDEFVYLGRFEFKDMKGE